MLQGWTPLHCAADSLSKDVVELLLSSTQETVNAADVKVVLILHRFYAPVGEQSLKAAFELHMHAQRFVGMSFVAASICML